MEHGLCRESIIQNLWFPMDQFIALYDVTQTCIVTQSGPNVVNEFLKTHKSLQDI